MKVLPPASHARGKITSYKIILSPRGEFFVMNHIHGLGLYTVESVTEGHPDKICDQISDAILDECLRQDPNSRVAVESFGGHGLLTIGGEVTTRASVNYASVAQDLYREIGYVDDIEIQERVVNQSPDIAQGVDTGGAGDQGIMYGYATDETPEYLPKGVVLAHALAKQLERVRRDGLVSWLKPDGKTQVTLLNKRVQTVLASAQHNEHISQEEIQNTITETVIRPVIGDLEYVNVLVNPTGRFVQGGFAADTGLTGRKIMVDTYGGLIAHGGGCFSGKDPSKVDRSGAYMCRFVAKNVVANGYASDCFVSVAYAIGKAEPLMISARDSDGHDLSSLVRAAFDFRPCAIIERLSLKQPMYRRECVYGHFGRNDAPWEQICSL